MMEILKPTNVMEVQLLNGFVKHKVPAKLADRMEPIHLHTLELRFAYRICTKRTCHLQPVCQIPTMRKRRNLKYVNLKGVKYKIQYIGETKSMLCERFKEHRKAANNPLHANATSAVPPHFS